MSDFAEYWQRRAVGRRAVLRGAFVGGVSLAGAALIGCGGSKPETASTPAAGGTAGAQGTAAAAAQPKRGGRVSVLKPGAPLGFDPHFALNWQYLTYASPVFSQLVRIDPTKSFPTDPSQIVPDLAEKWEFSPDGKTMVFSLRKGVKWHDGSAFTAKDVKWSIERMADPKTTFFSGDLIGLDKVETPDDFTVRVNWKQPSAGRLGTFASGYSTILSQEYHSKKDRKKEEFAMGTGPFKLTSFTSGREYKYDRNPDYYIPNRPYLDGIDAKITSVEALLPAMISGQGDINYWMRGGVSTEENAKQIRSQAPKLKIWEENKTPRPLGRGVYFNSQVQGPWQNPDVRKALALGVDPLGVLASQGEGWGIRHGWFMPGMALDIKEVDKLVGWDKPMAERLKEAKALLEKAGFKDGFKSRGLVRSSAEYLGYTQLIIADWKKNLNVDIALDVVDTATEVDRRQRHDYGILFFLSALRTGIHPVELASQFVSGAVENWSGIGDPAVDALFAKMGGLASGPELKAVASEANTLLLKSLGGIPFYFNVDMSLSKPEIKGLTGQVWLSNEDLVNVWRDA